MADVIPDTQKTPSLVIFTAVLNFITAFFGFFLLVIALIGLIFGNAAGIPQYLNQQMSQYSQELNLSTGITALFVVLLVLGLLVAVSSGFVGWGLLKGKRWAWYVQVSSSVVGLLGFPFWTILNAAILVFFFRQPIRGYFKV